MCIRWKLAKWRKCHIWNIFELKRCVFQRDHHTINVFNGAYIWDHSFLRKKPHWYKNTIFVQKLFSLRNLQFLVWKFKYFIISKLSDFISWTLFLDLPQCVKLIFWLNLVCILCSLGYFIPILELTHSRKK